MNTDKKTMVKLVGSLAVALALLWIPVSVHAGPTQSDDIVVSAADDGLAASWSLDALWNQLLSVVGVASSENPGQGQVPDNPVQGIDPTSTELLTVQDATDSTSGDVRTSIEPDG